MTREEAIKAIKGWDFLDEKEKETLETLIPELKKDDRERIKGNCIHFLELQKSHHASTIEIDECIDWINGLVPPKWLYRLEYKDGTCGLWYNGEGKWCFEQGIGSLTGCKTKDLPMDYDKRYKQDGRDWFSSCSKKEDLMHWYSLRDAEELIKKGFVFTRYLATEYHEYENETVFIKESSLVREEIDIFELFGNPTLKEKEEIDAGFTKKVVDDKVKEDIKFILTNSDLSKVSNKLSDMLDWLEKKDRLMCCLREANKKIGELVEQNYWKSEEDKKMIDNIISDIQELRNNETNEELIAEYEREIKWLKEKI